MGAIWWGIIDYLWVQGGHGGMVTRHRKKTERWQKGVERVFCFFLWREECLDLGLIRLTH